MDWERKLADIARSYKEGRETVEERRQAWLAVVKKVILPTLSEASEMLEQNGFRTYTKEFSTAQHQSVVQFSTDEESTGVAWSKGAGSLREDRLLIECAAAMGYVQGVDGRIAHWRVNHHLDDEDPPPASVVQVVDNPDELTVEKVREHILEFLQEALETSYRGLRREGRRISFHMPEPPSESDESE